MSQGADGDQGAPHRADPDSGLGLVESLVESPENDFEIEVSRVDDRPGGEPGDVESYGAPLSSERAPSPFGARLTLRRRALATLSAVAAVVLALSVVLGTLPGAVPALGTALGFATPTATATLAVGADTLYLANSVPWGTLTVDGRTQTVFAPGLGGIPQVKLGRGTHTLVYTATPFPPVRCKVSVPAATGDTCQLPHYPTLNVGFAPGTFRTVDLQAIPDHLSTDQYQALAAAIQAALVAPDGTVRAGDHYLADTGKTMVASDILTAHLVVGLPGRGEINDTINGIACDPLCSDPDFNPPVDGAWQVGAMVAFWWRFTDGSGQLVGITPATNPELRLLTFGATWSAETGTWSITLPSQQEVQQDFCAFADAQLWQVLSGTTTQTGGAGLLVSRMGTSDNPTDGCLSQINTSLPASSGTASSDPQYTVLYRFGALIAADPTTQQALPQLPLPSANERAIIAKLSKLSG